MNQRQKASKNIRVLQKKAPDNTFIVNLQKFTPGVKILKFKSDRKI